MIPVATSLSEHVGKKAACSALAIPRATYYRQCREKKPLTKPRPAPPLALSVEEKENVLQVAHEKRFWDATPYEIYATLLDGGIYYCSISTFYRVLSSVREIKERRKQVSRPHYKKPELLATGPNQVWSWDITKLKGPVKWTYFYLYVIMDIFSRYVVGWLIAPAERQSLAKELIAQTCEKQQISKNQLVLHADRGSSMKSKVVAQLLADLGVTKSHSRPYVSNDNPYSESGLKTLKYSPHFPACFGSIQDARSFCRQFFSWYNDEHKHSGIGLLPPKQVHYGLADEVLAQRSRVLQEAFDKNSNRFKGKCPQPPSVPKAAWINRPDNEIDFLNGLESESALARFSCQDRKAPQGNLDMETGNASFLKDGEKSCIEIDGCSVPMLN
jgi:putative transposase